MCANNKRGSLSNRGFGISETCPGSVWEARALFGVLLSKHLQSMIVIVETSSMVADRPGVSFEDRQSDLLFSSVERMFAVVVCSVQWKEFVG
jgi:hypothetical protein